MTNGKSEKTIDDKLSDSIHFKIVIKEDSYRGLVKEKLESAYPEMEIIKTGLFLYGNAKKSVYESVFNTELEVAVKTDTKSTVKKQSYWKELRPAEIPANVTEYVSKIFIPKPPTFF